MNVRTPRSGREPTFTERYKLGALLNRDWGQHACTLEELGAELGRTKQCAYTDSVLALGLFFWLLCERLGYNPRQVLAQLESSK